MSTRNCTDVDIEVDVNVNVKADVDVEIDTANAFNNARLIGLYFSAHW